MWLRTMDEGTLEFVARHKSWTGIYRTRVRPTDEVSKFLTFAIVLDKEIDRKIPDLLSQYGVEKKTLEKAADSVSMILETDKIKAAMKIAIKPIPRAMRKMVSAYIVRNAMIAKGVPFRYDPSLITEAREFQTAGSLSFIAKHPLWSKKIEAEIKEGDSFTEFLKFAQKIDDEVMIKLPEFFKELGVDVTLFEGMVETVAEAIDEGLAKSVTDSLPFVSPEVRKLAAAYAVRTALQKNKLPYDYAKGKIKPLLKKL